MRQVSWKLWCQNDILEFSRLYDKRQFDIILTWKIGFFLNF